MNSDCRKNVASKLSKEQIELSLKTAHSNKIIDVFVFDELDSTNQWLLDHLPDKASSDILCVAESQASGRGRNGRRWESPPNSNIYMSFSYRLVDQRRDISALSLVLGLALVRVLRNEGVTDVMLKWPNDVILGGKKLAGMLIEAKMMQGRLNLVIGLGINVNMPANTKIESALGWNDLSGVGLQDRNNLIALVYREAIGLIDRFFNEGFVSFREEWIACDEYAGKDITIIDRGKVILSGKNLGIDDDGCLLVQSGSEIKKIITGDVSLRLSDET